MNQDYMNFIQDMDVLVERNRGLQNDDLKKIKGKFKVEHLDKDGNLKDTFYFDNGVTNAGRDDILNVYFNSGTPKTTWYMGLVDNSGFSALAGADTMASHAGWSEFISYSGGARPTWTSGASSGQSVTNGTAITFNITAGGTINGIFIVSSPTLGGTSGTLWASGSFTSTVPVNNGDQLKITYTISD